MSVPSIVQELPASTPTRLLIGGEWIATTAGLDVINPASYGTLATIGDAGVAEGIQAVDAAHEAFQTWSLTPARVRAEILRNAFSIMTAEIDDCARLIALTVIVADVHQFPGHIACDAASKSEIVVPIIKDGRLIAVLDIDSPTPDRFDHRDQQGLEALLRVLLPQL